MTAEHWKKLEELFHDARVLHGEARQTYLVQACGSDEQLRVQAERLIAAHEEESNFLDSPVFCETAELTEAFTRKSFVGQSIGPYAVVSQIGQGGMGEVYLAEDARLSRKVAIKLLPAAFSVDQDRLRRFKQEAQAASALNHPNIVTIHEIGHTAGTHYIVTEYVEGETLREHIKRGKLSLAEALEIARQVASALEAAHAAGIVHRDIKPENVMLRGDGLVKVLDFGLAKLAPTTESDKLTLPELTKTGVVMGTVNYMSPEQVRGEKVDQRTDIFSLGVVLYEMVTGQRPFQGQSWVDVQHAIIHQEPLPAVALNSRLPVEVTDILGKALAKQLSERYRHAGDFELDLRRLKRAVESNSLTGAREKTTARQEVWWPSRRAKLILATLATVLIALSALAGWWLGRSGQAPARTVSLEGVILTPLTTDAGYEGEPTFSPDGLTIAYVANRTGNFEVFLKQISGGPDINLTNNLADDVQPAFSPDGKQIAFVSSRSGSSDLYYPGYDLPPVGGDIWVMPALGGAPRRIVDGGNFPSWSSDGSTVLYTSGAQFGQKLHRVNAQGGEPQEIPVNFETGTESTPRFLLCPRYSSDDRWIVFEVDRSGIGSRDVYVINGEGGEAQHIAVGQSPVWSSDSTAVIYSNGERGKNYTLWQVPFSIEHGRAAGKPEPLTVSPGRNVHASISRDGRQIAFAALEISSNAETVAFDAETGREQGAPQPFTDGSGVTYFQDLTADGRAIVFEARNSMGSHLWRMDRDGTPVQLTSDPDLSDTYPLWSPAGYTIAFNRRSAKEPLAATGVWLMAADGGNPHLLVENAGFFSWMPDGRRIVYLSLVDRQLYLFDLSGRAARRLTNEMKIVGPMTISADGQWVIFQSTRFDSIDLFTVPLAGGEVRTVVATPRQEQHAYVSPSGQWVYFSSNHKNIWRVPGPAQNWRQATPEKVTNFPESGLFLEDAQISRDGRWLLYARPRIKSDIWIMKLPQ
jgi:serine/threonine protein kinase/tricorn protease-like protein